MQTESFYQSRAASFQRQVDTVDKTIRQLSLSRLLIAALTLLFLYFSFSQLYFAFGIPVLIVAFVYLVQRQQQKEAERKILLHLIDLNKWEANALQNDFSSFPSGDSFVDPNHPYSHDLDIFGSGSVFQYLNRCATKLGEVRLADNLKYLNFTKEEIRARQEAIRDLAQQLELRQQCWAIGRQINSANPQMEPVLKWLQQPNLLLDNTFVQFAKWLLPMFTCGALVAISFHPIFKGVFFFLFIAQIAFAGWYGKHIDILQIQLARHRDALENFAKLFRVLVGTSFSSTLMQEHQRQAKEAAEVVFSFSKLVNALETRMNLFARFFGNGLFLYDFHAVSRLEAWRKQYASSLPVWLRSLAEWDSLLSFSTLHFNHPEYAFSSVGESFSISAKNAGHLLIPNAVRVTNSFDLGNPASLLLITGANMAGKSTFLRAVGTNYILALNGSPVCATAWSCPLAALRTGMRTSDSLQEHKSYFFAELNRLQSIMQELKSGKAMVILLDEILKGTNSTDKQAGSRELIKQLIQHRALVMVATHDIALGDMEAQFPQVSNACFEGSIENGELTFDYRLGNGVAKKANATFLMRKMGIIPNE